jgi:hypothetical protein
LIRFFNKENAMRRFAWLLALAAGLSAGGCGLDKFMNSRVIEAKLLSVEIIRDPDTGKISRVSHWQFPDGRVVTTQDRFAKDTPVTDRRGTGRAPIQIVD